MTTTAIRNHLYSYIRIADDEKIKAIYTILKQDIQDESAWWEDKKFVAELEKTNKALETGSDKGKTVEQLDNAIEKLRQKKYGKRK
ncbi:MAG: hypothetical protein P0Y53_02825 [Candidatus Pseudobacter hemicellulosilyticus]|uniref:Uncharacterized protein n=1 Tax=Candidatus Pseudobacter hemicellulosilyticus TaxID=3121375 RepID=A0AAJ5WVK8_9BACT|nr:MAG: hypothetical protein P0Y53_02825 [Pseudobacter sp.]